MPSWNNPQDTAAAAVKPLSLYNTLTKTKNVFAPITTGKVKWYSCGPTVYDAAHMGHARNYVSIDINRRVLRDYFHYDVHFVQNVTDIDDKIIIRARQNYLFEQYTQKAPSVSEVTAKAQEGLARYIAKNLPDSAKFASVEEWAALIDLKAEMIKEEKLPMYLKTVTTAQDALKDPQDVAALLALTKDVIVPVLDKEYGATVNDPAVFLALPAYWEYRFDQDMARLDVLEPDTITRVTEYVPEIATFVEKIIANGFAYATADGSVYFDTVAFDRSDNHDYAKLVPSNKNNLKLIEEGEGSLSVASGKRSPSDFALWKGSKPGEPAWASPWGQGRPGWHIECSVMASDILGQQIDIHSGGIDLAFPHHDNELAQSEAHYDCQQWVNYFLHTGHLHIEGSKMSKSLKNFISIDEALTMYSARQLRLCFALTPYNNPLDFKGALIDEVKNYEGSLSKFFTKVRALKSSYEHDLSQGKIISKKITAAESALEEDLEEAKRAVHEAFCDNLNTPLVMRIVGDLVSKTNTYISGLGSELKIGRVVRNAQWVSQILAIVGFRTRADGLGWSDASVADDGASFEETVSPVAKILSSTRDTIRTKGIELKDAELLQLSDSVRQELLQHGISIDDQTDGPALVKFLSSAEKTEMLKQQQEKDQKAQEKLQKKAQQAREIAEKARLADEKAKVRPEDLFKSETDKYSTFDEAGMPTKDAAGEEITKSMRKKLQKLYDQQKKLHEAYLERTKN
ncbi:hypothetical protein BABINDRAFT_171265 [Babjeviella inositovora NRRL Y-12698]|uniref:cysteine--tRNA ligase n=1 Tax=Babjeviella inositovora NRRL Y-12698 TaxID=984486 RepID=A0A1E3QRK1_9ASCO|nr:uncharacterized protein BABINDRAFT_171265 [Babjeviella inositovora NRRL Y-12698]ODQ80325.1 hypothetical protein BABINDRAFT_171265 [Babjeviella inositovora NRRL Y-12698]